MDPALFSTSTVAAFLGGMIALAAPCCVTFLLPAYLASAFRARHALLGMTLVFALGVAAVLLPITLGVAALSRLVNEYHGEVFLLGGLFLVFLGVVSLSGRNIALPMMRPTALGDQPTVLSVFSLGVFSGAASSCCAPVLAGVLTLSAISSSLIQSTAVGLAYVAGMVSPLVVIALLWERFNLSGSILIRGRALSLSFRRWRWRVHSTNLLAGLLFLAVGAFVIATAFSGGFAATEGQSRLGEYMRSAADAVIQATKGVPDIWFTLLLATATLYLFGRAFGPRLGAAPASLARLTTRWRASLWRWPWRRRGRSLEQGLEPLQEGRRVRS
jgi:cytochrome c biogenesis protein CcdA